MIACIYKSSTAYTNDIELEGKHKLACIAEHASYGGDLA